LNRQIFPSALFPLRGDISAESGATTVTVQGLQNIPIIAPPVEPAGLDTLFYDSYNNDWFYASPWDIPVGIPLVWEGYGYGSSGISWIAPDTLAFGNGADGDVSGAAAMTALVLFGSASYCGPYDDYDVEYGPSYDQFYTSVFSGATQNWNLILPPNPGTSGQVLTTNGTGVTYWSTVSGGGGGTSPGGSNGDIQYNNSGAFGGSASTISAGGTITLPTTQAIIWGTDTSISRISGGLVAIGSGSVGSETGGIILNTINLGDEFYDNTDYAGANGWVLSSTGTKTLWINPATSLAVPGSTGDILYNNGGVMGASLATITSTGGITLPDTQVIKWGGAAYSGVGLSQLAADTLAVGNGSDSDVSGAMAMTGLILFGSSYYSAYDAFHTTIYSGATQNWNLVLPETAGTNGQVLTNIGSGFTEWNSLSAIGVPWSALTSATANLTLANGTFTTTFQQTANTAWLWQNTTVGTSGSTNASPLLEFAANYYTGATSAQDLWTLGSSLAAGTNGASTLAFNHTGSSGTALVSVPALVVGASATPCSIACLTNTNYGLEFTNSGIIYAVSAGTPYFAIGKSANTVTLVSSGAYAWSSGAVASTVPDTGISRISAGVVGVGTGAAGSIAGSLQLNLITSYGGNTTTKGGVPSVLATSFLTAQTSAISGQSIVSSASSYAKGMWRISFVATQTTAGSAGTVLGGTTGFTITFTNANGDTASKTTALSAPATGVGTSTSDTISGNFYAYAGASTNITYSFGYTAGSITGGAFDIAVYAELLG
jgi:hypothetical protein